MSDNPIAGVDLEAEQVVEEEAEKPVSTKKKKIRTSFVVFGAVVIVEAIVLAMVFGTVGGGDRDEAGGSANAEGRKQEVNEQSLDVIGKRGPLPIGDISHLEPSPSDPKRQIEVTITELKIVFDEKGWSALQTLFGKYETAQELVTIDLQHHVRAFMSRQGADLLLRRGDAIQDDLLSYFNDLSGDAIGGLSQHVVDIGFTRVKSATR